MELIELLNTHTEPSRKIEKEEQSREENKINININISGSEIRIESSPRKKKPHYRHSPEQIETSQLQAK